MIRLEVRMPPVMEQVHALADTIGPRPATTDAEARAADLIEDIMRVRGLDPERQEFDCPRTDAWPQVVYGLLLVAAVVVSIFWPLPALIVSLIAAALVWLDVRGTFSVARLLGSGPSQNIIGRHVPRARRNERLKKVVIVAHYDSARPSFLDGPGVVRNAHVILALARWIPVAVTAWIALIALPFAAAWRPWAGWVALAGSALVLPAVAAGIQRAFLSHATDGANDNASGVAAMLEVMAATVPESDEMRMRTMPIRRGVEAIEDAEVVDDDVILEYQPVAPTADDGQMLMQLDDVEASWPRSAPMVSVPEAVHHAQVSSGWRADEEPERTTAAPSFDDLGGGWGEDEIVPGQASFEPEGAPDDVEIAPAPEQPDRADYEAPRRSRRERRTGETEEGKGVRDWLGIGRGFDVRRAGKEIGSWENIDHDDDEFGFKAGAAGEPGEPYADASSIAARIRRRVTDGVDRALAEKEIWFVATGAAESGGWGMRALLDAYGDELRDAAIINIDTVGSGTVAFVTEEGLHKRYRADRRLVTQVKRTVREKDLQARGQTRRGASSDATVAIGRGFRAMSVMAFDINGRLPNWHWHTDTTDAVSQESIEQAAALVSALVRDL